MTSAAVLAAPASAQIVRTFDQSRSTHASANGWSRDNSVIGFGTFSSDLHVLVPGDPSVAAAAARQASGIYGDSTLAGGDASAQVNGASGNAGAASEFSVYFRVDAPTGYTLIGRVTSHTSAGIGGTGDARAEMQFSDASGALASSQSDCGFDSASPCDDSQDLAASGVLAPGIYHLEARANAAATGSALVPVGAGTATFALRIWFDGPIVGSTPATWSVCKSLYR